VFGLAGSLEFSPTDPGLLPPSGADPGYCCSKLPTGVPPGAIN